VVDWRGKLDSRKHQGRSFEFCPSPSQANLHNSLKYPSQLIVSKKLPTFSQPIYAKSGSKK